jgi:hypothetical protein
LGGGVSEAQAFGAGRLHACVEGRAHSGEHRCALHAAPILPPGPPPNRPQEATEALKPILGRYYCRDTRNVMAALWEESASCHYVEPDTPGGGVLWFRSMVNRPKAE